ncbi:hypothetical protein THAOC_29749, partial [Thalassiosira oceanica]
MKEDPRARSVWKVALSKALGPGSTGRASGRPGKVRKASNGRDSATGLGQKRPRGRQSARPARGRVVWDEPPNFDPGCRIWTKSSFPESSRRALQVTLNRRVEIHSPPGGSRRREGEER